MKNRSSKSSPKFNTDHFFELAPELLAIANLDGYFVQLNSKWAETIGYSLEELMARPFVEFVHPDDIENTIAESGALFDQAYKTVDFQNRYLTASGRYLWLAWNATQVDGYIYAAARDITDLKNQELYFKETQETAKIGHWRIDLESNTPIWSDKTYDIHDMEVGSQVNLEEAINFYPEGGPRETVTEVVNTAIEKGESWDLELPFITAKNRNLWVRAIGKSVVDQGKVTEIYGVFQDITEQKNIELQHKYLVEEVSDGIWDWWIKDEYEYMSPRFWEILGYDPSEKTHHPSEWQKLIFKEDLQLALKTFEKHVASKGKIPFWLEARYRHKNGSTVWVICHGKVVQWDSDGSAIRMIGSHTDITQLKMTQMKLTQNAKLASLGEMAGNVAHEINNPLCIISNSMDTLRTLLENPSPKTQQMALTAIDTVEETVDRITKIISGMRLLLRDDRNVELKVWRLNEIFESSLELCAGKMKSRDILFDLNLEAPDIQIKCNITQISQIILNLLNNSIYEVGSHERPWIKVHSFVENGRLVINFTESGQGLPLEKVGNIFEPFFTTKPLGKGTGLGLSISKEIANAHGGDLKYLAEEKNTTFSLQLPIAPIAQVS